MRTRYPEVETCRSRGGRRESIRPLLIRDHSVLLSGRKSRNGGQSNGVSDRSRASTKKALLPSSSKDFPTRPSDPTAFINFHRPLSAHSVPHVPGTSLPVPHPAHQTPDIHGSFALGPSSAPPSIPFHFRRINLAIKLPLPRRLLLDSHSRVIPYALHMYLDLREGVIAPHFPVLEDRGKAVDGMRRNIAEGRDGCDGDTLVQGVKVASDKAGRESRGQEFLQRERVGKLKMML